MEFTGGVPRLFGAKAGANSALVWWLNGPLQQARDGGIEPARNHEEVKKRRQSKATEYKVVEVHLKDA